jgi:hypothetical protein
MAFKELEFSIDVRNISVKIAFVIVKSCNAKDNNDGHAGLSWEKLKKKYDPVSVPSLVKTERMF